MRRAHAFLVLAACLAFAGGARAQVPNPVYVDVSPVARDALLRAGELASGGNLPGAARELQKLLDESPDRVVADDADPDLFVPVRARVHAMLLASPPLLTQYLATEESRAREMLAPGTLEAARAVESTRLLTTAGFEAAMRVAQWRLESACFEAARLTLEQLEEHPRLRDPASARQAAELYWTVGRYLEGDRPEVRRRAERWSALAGVPVPGDAPAERPPELATPVLSPLTVTSTLDVSGVPSRPLWSVPIEPPGASEAPPPAPNTVVEGKDPEGLWILPTVAGDTLYLNDGTWITARDRFTLQLRWAVEPGRAGGDDARWAARNLGLMRGAGRAIEDNNSVTLAGRIVLATTGLARDGSREGDPRTHALDADTGRLLWSVHVPALDPQLESGSVRGPALADGDTVVVMVRKSAMARRVVSTYLVGLALRTGELRWVRLIASAGALPFSRERRIGDVPTMRGGVVYVVDPIGAAGAVEASTGRPVWVRRLPVVTMGDTSLPWRFGAPLVSGPSVFALTPDRREALVMGCADGRITGRRPSRDLGEPGYLLAAGGRLAAVGDARIAFVPMDDLTAGPVVSSRAVAEGGLRGRSVVSGSRVLAPHAGGLVSIDPDRPTEAIDAALSAPGTPMPVPDQLIVLDSREVHSYLAWPVAQRLLRDRMAARPEDPDPAVTYAELAFRAGHGVEVAGAADRALAAIERDPSARAAARARLFESLREMVSATQDRWGAPPDPSRPGLDLPDLAAVIDRLGRAALTAEERLTHVMATGRLHEAALAPTRAIEAYQRILADANLSAASWRGPTTRVRAEVEAAARIRRIVLENGAGSYAAFDAEADAAVAALGPSATSEALEAVAHRYPAAAAGAAVWARIAEARDRAGLRDGAIDALTEALSAVEFSRRAGRAVDASLEGAVAGRLVAELAARDRVFSASRLLASIRRDRPGLALSDRGRPLDAAGLAADLSRRLSALERLPRVGPAVRPEAQTLRDWALMTPTLREHAATPCEHVMMVAPREGKVALWGVGSGSPADASRGPEHLTMLWSRPYERFPPVLLRVDPESVDLLWDLRERGASVERIDAVTGATRWKTEPLRELFRDAPGHRERLELDGVRFDTELDKGVEARHLVCASDGIVLALAERIGRVAAFDARTGATLWRTVSEVSRVHDLDVGGGIVAIGGSSTPAGNASAVARLDPLVVVHDARTGAIVRRLADLRAPVRWLRAVPPAGTPAPGLVICAGAITGVDPRREGASWSIEGGPAFEALDAWVFGDRLFVLTRDRELWLVALADGGVADAPLETFDRLKDGGPVQAVRAPAEGPGAVAFLGARGVLVYDTGAPGGPPSARLIGIDALSRSTGLGAFPDAGVAPDLVTPVPCRGGYIALETWPARLPDGRTAYTLHRLDGRTGKMVGTSASLVLFDAPRKLGVLDGRIIVTTGTSGSVTVVYSAPEEATK